MLSGPLDLRAIADRADLRRLVEAELGPPDRSGKWRCPFHDDHTPSLSVSLVGQRWRFKCWSAECGEHGDALDWLRRGGLSVAEAVERLEPGAGAAPLRRPRPAPAPRPVVEAPPPTWQDPAWQAAVDVIVREAEDTLWSRVGRPALDWLRARGLSDTTIRQFRLGFLPRGAHSEPVEVLSVEGEPRAIRAPRGIVLPWVRPGAWYDPGETDDPGPRWVGANVRRLGDDVFGPLPEGAGKCLALTGSSRGHAYPWADLLPSQGSLVALLVEGEFDALLATQEAGDLAVVLTVGGAGQPPQPSALEALARCPRWLIAFDHDKAGDIGSLQWLGREPAKARRVRLPFGKDPTDFHLAGGNIREWVRTEVARTPTLPTDSWRGTVARWPAPAWLAWRAEVSAALKTRLTVPTADDIRSVEHAVFQAMRIENSPLPESQG